MSARDEKPAPVGKPDTGGDAVQQSGDVHSPQSVYRRLVRDDRVSHGAFRLWHYLKDRANREGICWPQQRTISAELHCKVHSLTGWIRELAECGYLSTEIKGANHHFEYRLLFGVVMPKSATRRDAQKGNAKPAVLPSRHRRIEAGPEAGGGSHRRIAGCRRRTPGRADCWRAHRP